MGAGLSEQLEKQLKIFWMHTYLCHLPLRFPSGMRVLGWKLVLLARSGEADAMLDIIRNNPAGRDDPALYMYAYKVFVENGHREEGQRILLAASEHFPDNVVGFISLCFWFVDVCTYLQGRFSSLRTVLLYILLP